MKAVFGILLLTAAAMFTTADLHHYALPFWNSPHEPVVFEVSNSPWECFFEVFGMIYAILGGFLLVKVLDRFSVISRALEGEINAAQDVRDFLLYFEPDQRNARRHLLARLLDYVRAIRLSEWPRLRKAGPERKRMSADTSPELMKVMAALQHLRAEGRLQETALEAMMNKLSDLTSFRTQRISMAYERLPFRLKVLLAFLSAALVGAFVVMPVGAPILHLSMVAVVTAAAYLVFTIILDLDHPFAGIWNISLKPLLETEAQMARQLEELDQDIQLPGPDFSNALEDLPAARWNPVASQLLAGASVR